MVRFVFQKYLVCIGVNGLKGRKLGLEIRQREWDQVYRWVIFGDERGGDKGVCYSKYQMFVEREVEGIGI